jgi:penicillin-insensitive murein DD-endopeptidase
MRKRVLLLFFTLFIILPSLSYAKEESVCYGTTSRGRLKNGWQLPSKGKNFASYALLGNWIGRTYVHSKVHKTVVDTYEELRKQNKNKVFMYGETGFKEGGLFKPHKTHQNGLSVDFMVPIINKKGQSIRLPTTPLNKYGYEIEFDHKGDRSEYSIDFEAMGAHLDLLQQAAQKNHVNIWRVIFDPKLQPYLFRTKTGKNLKNKLKFSQKKSWVRHDEHYHVDFVVKCMPY